MLLKMHLATLAAAILSTVALAYPYPQPDFFGFPRYSRNSIFQRQEVSMWGNCSLTCEGPVGTFSQCGPGQSTAGCRGVCEEVS